MAEEEAPAWRVGIEFVVVYMAVMSAVMSAPWATLTLDLGCETILQKVRS